MSALAHVLSVFTFHASNYRDRPSLCGDGHCECICCWIKLVCLCVHLCVCPCVSVCRCVHTLMYVHATYVCASCKLPLHLSTALTSFTICVPFRRPHVTLAKHGCNPHPSAIFNDITCITLDYPSSLESAPYYLYTR